MVVNIVVDLRINAQETKEIVTLMMTAKDGQMFVEETTASLLDCLIGLVDCGMSKMTAVRDVACQITDVQWAMEIVTLTLIVGFQHGKNVSRMDASTEIIFPWTSFPTIQMTDFCQQMTAAEKGAIPMNHVGTMLKGVKRMMTAALDSNVWPQDSVLMLMNAQQKLEQDHSTVALEPAAPTPLDLSHVPVMVVMLAMFPTQAALTLMNVPTISTQNAKPTQIA